MTDPLPHLFWITSRAAGSAALIITSLSVSFGLLMALRLKLRGRGLELRAVHEALAIAGLIAIAVHGATLIGDSYLHPSLADISIPFASHYRTGWTSAGIVAGWSLAALGLSYYARARIGAARWRNIHRLTTVAWGLGLAHSLGEGTDAGQIWFIVMLVLVAAPALVLLVLRWGKYVDSAEPKRPVPARERASIRREAPALSRR